MYLCAMRHGGQWVMGVMASDGWWSLCGRSGAENKHRALPVAGATLDITV